MMKCSVLDCRGFPNEHVKVRVGDLDYDVSEHHEKEYQVEKMILHQRYTNHGKYLHLEHRKLKKEKEEMN